MRIGRAATSLGVAMHVLRHWEDLGVVVPDRSASGHRDYAPEHVTRLRIVRACQEVGFSLAEIRLVLHRDEAGREEAITRRLEAIERQRAALDAAASFLSHVRECRHDLLTRCPSCTDYAQHTQSSLDVSVDTPERRT